MVRANKRNSDMISLKFDNSNKLVLQRINNDYYFMTKISEEEVEKTFEISIDDYDLYVCMDKLYNRFIEYRPFENGQVDQSLKLEDLDSQYPLVKDGVITWYSDGSRYDAANSFEISKTEDSYIFKMRRNPNNIRSLTPVRIKTYDSRYDFFYQPFIELYRELGTMEFDYPQISIEEYLVKSKIKKRK